MLKPSSFIIKTVSVFISLILSLIFWRLGSFDSLDLFFYDLGIKHLVNRNQRSLNPRILKIDLNDSSEAALGERLDSREAFGDLLAVLGDYGASAGLDFIFQSRKSGDIKMVNASESFDNLVYSVVPVPEGYNAFSPVIEEQNRNKLKENLWHIKGDTKKIPKAVSFVMSNADISSSATMLGHIGIHPDKNGIYRRVPLFYQWEDGVIPSLPLALAVRDLGIKPEELEFISGKGLILPMGEGEKPLIIPCDAYGNLLIPYSVRWETNYYRYSFSKLIEIAEAEAIDLFSEFYGVIAIIADTTSGKRDYGNTPFDAMYPLSGIHAAVLSGILDEVFFTENHIALKSFLLFILFLSALFLCLQGKERFFHSGHIFLFLFLTISVFCLWNYKGRIPWYGVPVFFVFASWVLGFSKLFFVRYHEQLLFRSALSRYFPYALAERVIREGKTELIPSYKELTILFSDISGFTKWSSDKNPDEVHNFLNDYLESMAEIIFSHGGSVDKFMGDGILAFFGDPYDMPDHCEQCIRAAIAMQKRIKILAEKWKPIAGIDLKVRIGVNTGKVIVGNLGNKTRIEYTVIGAAVNIAQRMESNAPAGGILAAQAAWEKTKNYFTFSEKREISVKGYSDPVFAWEVINENL
ncbi:MAG: adenylate/guanylate cyclase domain-containing protein [Treponema sp.]|jgi:adenylate cyclase|nr:adenylate/guanylate cyclase domain-containing protein [Treponema sp.]